MEGKETQEIRKFFPSFDRFCQYINCCRAHKDGVDTIKEKNPMLDFNDMYKNLAGYADKICPRLKVCGTGILAMDPNVLHPFVRIHIIDLNTKKYLAKKNWSPMTDGRKCNNGVAQFENFSAFKLERNDHTEQFEKAAYKADADFYMPMSTRMFDMRVSGTNFCQWDEEFVINA